MARTLQANNRTYRISAHAWARIRQIDIDLADVARIIEAPQTIQKLKHKTEYTGCYTPRYAAGTDKRLAVKIVVNTRSTLTLKTAHNLGDCPE